MKNLLLFGLLALASCAHPQSQPKLESEPIGADAVPPDSTLVLAPAPVDSTTIVVGLHRSLIDKVFGRTPAPITYTGATSFKAGKKSTITINHNHVAGNQTNSANTAGKNAVAGAGATGGGKGGAPVAGAGAELTSIGKSKAPTTTGAGDATDQAGAGAASTIKGNNNAPVLTNTEQDAPGVGATIAGAIATPVGKVIAVLLVAGAGYGIYRLWPVLLRRKSTNNEA